MFQTMLKSFVMLTAGSVLQTPTVGSPPDPEGNWGQYEPLGKGTTAARGK